MNKHYRLVILLIAYDPYKDVFDIFMEQMKKNWPDCPYPIVIANMYFHYEGDNIILINCGDVKSPLERKRIALKQISADYFLGFEEDRVLIEPVNTQDVEDILDFMEENNIDFFRCNASRFKKKKKDQYPGYDHFFHIPGNEPYGVNSSTSIYSRRLMEDREKNGLDNGYVWEDYQNKRAAFSTRAWVDKYATDDRNVFHILHCIEKQKWIAKSKRILEKNGYDLSHSNRQTQNYKETILLHVKELFMRVPGKTRHFIKKNMKKIGFRFATEY